MIHTVCADWVACRRIDPGPIRVSPATAYGQLRWAGGLESADISVLDRPSRLSF